MGSLFINRRQLSIALGVVFLVLLAAHLAAIVLYYKVMPENPLAAKLDQFFDMDREVNFPTYFNTILLFIVAQTFFLMGKSSKRNEDRYSRTYWYFLSIIFVFLSIDEFVSIHERFIDLLPHVFGIGGTGMFRFAWIIPYGIFVIAFGIYSIPFLLSLEKEYAVKYLIAGAVYISGAIIVEALGGIVFEQNNSIPSFEYILFFVTPEETMEMLPLIYVININLKHLSEAQ